MRVKAGVDVLLEDPRKYLSGLRVGLITNPTGVTAGLTTNIDTFHEHVDIDLRAVFGPEHGARGDIQDGLPVEPHVDKTTGLPVHSLYGEARRPTAEMLEGIDALVFDIQDVGARFYTYPSTLTYSLEVAGEQGIPLFVLDRPNPINGVSLEGNILEPGFASFVGLHPFLIRHGLTIGEIAMMANESIRAQLEIVKMECWERPMWFDETGLPWVQPSPNLPSLETAVVYPGTCFFEGVNLSEGRGTTRPFEYVGATWLDGRELASSLNGEGLPGVLFRPCHFTPTFDKHAGELCGGVQVHVTDRDDYRSVETGLRMLAAVIDLWPEELRWLPPRTDGLRHFDRLAGTDKVREALSRGTPVEEIVGGWSEGLEWFRERRREFLLYPEGGR
jgi:uncharacterized protein YbbC (DUF1343 family)